MAYITPEDYLLHIQDQNIQQIINNNEAIRDYANMLAMAESRSYLIQKYDIDAEYAKTGDDRDAQMLSTTIDIALYHLHTRIAPRNIPELRVTRYENAVMWLKNCADGQVTPALVKLDPLSGTRVRIGSNPKNTNIY